MSGLCASVGNVAATTLLIKLGCCVLKQALKSATQNNPHYPADIIAADNNK
jgi:hypothetical protein